MSFLVVHKTITVYYQTSFSTTFSDSSLNKPNQGIPNAATERLKRIFMRGNLSCCDFDEKLCLKSQNRQVHLHLPEEGDVNVLTKNMLPYASFPGLRHAARLQSRR